MSGLPGGEMPRNGPLFITNDGSMKETGKGSPPDGAGPARVRKGYAGFTGGENGRRVTKMNTRMKRIGAAATNRNPGADQAGIRHRAAGGRQAERKGVNENERY